MSQFLTTRASHRQSPPRERWVSEHTIGFPLEMGANGIQFRDGMED